MEQSSEATNKALAIGTIAVIFLSLLFSIVSMKLSEQEKISQSLTPVEYKANPIGNETGTASLKVKNLRVEYLVNPLGIDVLKPRLSWIVESSERGQFQTAYQIIVSSSRQKLDNNIGDLWDSGKVQSNETTQITYAGKPLSSRIVCWWKVRVWDKYGRPSEWSEPAYWTIGLLKQEDWKAKWIGYEYTELSDLNFDGCKWIWFNEGNPTKEAPVGDRYFRRTINLPADKRIQRGTFLITADDQFVLFVNGKEAGASDGKPDAWQRPQIIDITDLLHAGLNVFAIKATNTGGPAGLIGKVVIEFKDGGSFILVTDKSWKSSMLAEDGWESPGFNDSGWISALEMGDYNVSPWKLPAKPPSVWPAPYFRKSFTVEKRVKQAFLYVSALGSCELHLNGKLVTEDYFIPGWPDYRKRAFYRTYNVTDLLRQGENVIGVILGSEWYSGYQGGWGVLNKFGRGPRLLIQLEIEYDDGERQLVVSDGSWKAMIGPIVEADNYMGETYDARREMPGWDEPGFDDSGWRNVFVDNNVNLQLTANPGPPVRKLMELHAQSVREVSPGVFVFDMGQNMVGVARLKVRNAEPGTKITLRFAEVLNPDGTIYTANLRGAKDTDTYICKGGEEEVFEPHFTYRGFRYVEVTGYPGKPPLDVVTGIVVGSDVPITGEFNSSNPLLNRLVQNIIWSMRGNYFEVPTDCPQRDERQGWTGDAQLFAGTAAYLGDISAFMTRWLIDLNDGQREDGAYPDVAPNGWRAGFGTPGWGDAGIIIPYVLWRTYGDTEVIRRYYGNMVHYINYLIENSNGFLRPAIGYGDWVPAGPETPKDVIATAYFAYDAKLMAEMAQAIGKTDDAKRFEELFNNIRAAFLKAYVQPDGRIKGETQTSYALALDFDLLPEGMKEKALEYLVKDIEERGWHLSTGFIGTRYILPVLTKYGRTDVAYRLLLQETYPSWLYEVKLGATTIWERWDSMKEENGKIIFQDPGMNSFNHYAFGSVGQWIFSTVAGISSDGPGFEKIIIKPHPLRELGHVHASYMSIHGPISVDWWFSDQAFHLKVTIPANTLARVYVPTTDHKKVEESGVPAEKAEGVQFIGMEEGYAVYLISSGSYHFVVTQ